MEGPRACRADELSETLVFLNNIFRLGSDQSLETDYPLIFNNSKLDYMRIIKDDGRVVAHVPIAPREMVVNGDVFTVGIISPTGTDPDYRHLGYGTACLRDCLRIMAKKDWPVSVLWTREATFPFYQKSGFEPVGPQQLAYPLSQSDHHMFDYGDEDVVIYNPGNRRHLDSVIEIHDAEPLRVGRTYYHYEKYFSLPKIVTLIALNGGRVISYLMISRASNKDGIIEGGGHAGALETLFKQALIFQDSKDSTYAFVPLTTTVVGDLLERKKPKSAVLDTEAGIGFQMLRVNSVFSLMTKITGYLRKTGADIDGQVCIVCTDDDEAVTLRFSRGEVEISPQRSSGAIEFDRRQITRLIFGPHPAADPVKVDGESGEILSVLFPYYFPVWELDHS